MRIAVLCLALALVLALVGSWLDVRHQRFVEQGLLRLALLELARGMRSRLPWLVAGGAVVTLAIPALLALALRAPSGRRSARLAERVLAALGAAWPVRLAGGFALVALLTWGAVAWQDHHTSVTGPSLIIVAVDTLRADHVGCYGDDDGVSPRIDSFAAESTVFEQARSAASWTRPAMASILSGRHPLEFGLLHEGREERLPVALPTLAEVLRNQGYRTAAFVTNPHYRFGLLQGFEHVWFRSDAPAERVYDDVLTWLSAQGDRPFFLLVHNNDPHDDYRYHKGFSKPPVSSKLRGPLGLLPVRGDDSGLTFDSAENRAGTVILDPAQLAEMEENYDGEIRYLDHHFGRLLDTLDALGRREKTIVVLTADHGEEFLDHGSYWHGGTVYDELLHVPLVIRTPGRDPARVAEPVGTIDLFPTLLELMGVPAPRKAAFWGRSLVPLLDGAPWTARPQVAATEFRGPLKLAVIHEGHKLIRFADGSSKLFDLARDPGERTDRAAADPARRERLTALLDALRARAAGSAVAAPAGGPALDAATEAQLRALGYLGDD